MKITDKRIDKWKKTDPYPIIFQNPVDPEFEKLLESQRKNDAEKLSELDILGNAKELIFNVTKKEIKFHVISPSLNTKDMKLKYDHYLDVIFANDDSSEKQIIRTLGLAVALEIPVFPNTKKVEERLIYYYKKLINNGFVAPNNDGEDVRLKPVNVKKLEDFQAKNISNINSLLTWSSMDILMLKETVRNELLRLDNANRTLTSLEIAISDLEFALNDSKRNENRLQVILTSNPILFGLDYSRVIPKHQLGKEYEVDYALEKYSGIVDLVEIESSSLKLFTQGGQPTSHLIHAEQQVFDWIDWVEKKSYYAREDMEGLISPKGFVIIGRSDSLNEKNKQCLIRRNKVFNNQIEILTYDDLLDRAKVILKILKKEGI